MEGRTPKPWIYIASPYTKGDRAINVRTQMVAFDYLLTLGVVPIAPLYSHFQHLFLPRPYADWIAHDLEVIQRCDACFRISAHYFLGDGTQYLQHESSGADGEVREFERLGRPVFNDRIDLERWVEDWTASKEVAR